MKHTNIVALVSFCSFLVVALVSCSSRVVPIVKTNIQKFKEIQVDFHHKWDDTVHPFLAAAVIDIDQDQKMEIFVGGGNNQADGLFSYQNGKLVNIIQATGLSSLAATHGATSIDMDNDGDVDLLVARDNGIFLYLNNQGVFQKNKIPVNFPKNSIPLNIAVADIDKDQDLDLYISVFVSFPAFRSATYNDPEHAKTNILLLNKGDLIFEDITSSSGTASKNNTFTSAFLDLDGDQWQDLVVAQNTGEIEIFRNLGSGVFEPVPLRTDYGFWMGLVVGDIDEDGDQDLFFSNVGKTIPSFLTRGDLRDDQQDTLGWLLLLNEGNFKFKDVTKQYNLINRGFGWGGVFEDLNHDGMLDLLVAQNYIKWPFHKIWKLPARTTLQLPSSKGGNAFFHFADLGLENSYFGQAPLIVDIDNNGVQDVLWINMDGPLRAFLNQTTANYLTVVLPDNLEFLGARVTIKTNAKTSYTRESLANIGMSTDQTTELSFGLGNSASVSQVIVQKLDGEKILIENPKINQKLFIK